MQITSKFTIAIHIIVASDFFKESHLLTSNFLAESTGANPVIIRNIIGNLKKVGIINSTQGKRGLSLAKDLEEISFYDVYQAVGAMGDEGLFHFHEKPNMACPVGQNIHLMLDKRLQQVQEVMENELRQIKISDVVNEVNF